eukprot:3867653-Rhodomonas_salina.3
MFRSEALSTEARDSRKSPARIDTLFPADVLPYILCAWFPFPISSPSSRICAPSASDRNRCCLRACPIERRARGREKEGEEGERGREEQGGRRGAEQVRCRGSAWRGASSRRSPPSSALPPATPPSPPPRPTLPAPGPDQPPLDARKDRRKLGARLQSDPGEHDDCCRPPGLFWALEEAVPVLLQARASGHVGLCGQRQQHQRCF